MVGFQKQPGGGILSEGLALHGRFDAVMVNADDAQLRRNRLALLAELRRQFTRIADLSCLPG